MDDVSIEEQAFNELKANLEHAEELKKKWIETATNHASKLLDIQAYIQEAYNDESDVNVLVFIENFAEEFNIDLEKEYKVTIDTTINAIVTARAGYEFSESDFDIEFTDRNDNISIENVSIDIHSVDQRETS